MSKSHYLSLFPNSSGDTLPGTENVGRLFYKLSTDVGLYVCTPSGWQKVTNTNISVDWNNVNGKPLTFPPSAHQHEIADIENLASTLSQKVDILNIGTYITWDNISGKPTTFATGAHTHEIADVNLLTEALAAKASIADLSGKEDKSKKGVANGYAPLNSTLLVPTANLGAGTANAGTYLRGDGTWGTIALSGGGVQSLTVTPTDGVIASITNPTTTPNLLISLGDITPDSVATSIVKHASGIQFQAASKTQFSINSVETAFATGIRENITTFTIATATYIVDLSNGTLFDLTLNANCTYTFPTIASSKGKQFTIFQTQGATPRTVTWPTDVRWAGGTAPTITATASKTDVISFVCDGSRWFGFISGLNFTKT